MGVLADPALRQFDDHPRRAAGRSIAESATPAGHGGTPRAYVLVLHPRSDAVTARSGREADFRSWPKSRIAVAVPWANVARTGGAGRAPNSN